MLTQYEADFLRREQAGGDFVWSRCFVPIVGVMLSVVLSLLWAPMNWPAFRSLHLTLCGLLFLLVWREEWRISIRRKLPQQQ